MGDLLEYVIEYFSEARNPGNPGNWDGFDLARKEDAAEFHREITDMMNRVSNVDTNAKVAVAAPRRSEEHTSELQSRGHLVCRLLLEKKKHNLRIRLTIE